MLAEASAVEARTWSARWGWGLALAALGVLSAMLVCWRMGEAHLLDYYASTVLSMSRNWSNFFFGAVDPAGTVTVDKIPGSFWVPALLVRLFGLSAWAVLLPNALAAVGATVLTAVTARRLQGPVAGLVAGAIVATTPVLVAVARSDEPETFFVLGCAATAWAATAALQRASFGWLIVAAVFVGLSFQAYMLEAWAVWPALGAAWLFTSGPFVRRMWRLAVAGAISIAVSLSWIAAVALVPANARPYEGSTIHDSPWEMVFGYNGLGRFGSSGTDAYRSFTPPYSGAPGVLRLFNAHLAGQIGWLIPTALLAAVLLFRLGAHRAVSAFLAAWLVVLLAMFSTVAGMHQFYTAVLAVPLALTIGVAFAAARERDARWAWAGLVLTAGASAVGITFAVARPSLLVAAVQLAIALGAAIAILRGAARGRRAGVFLLAACLTGLTATPFVWAVATATASASGDGNPIAVAPGTRCRPDGRRARRRGRVADDARPRALPRGAA